MSQNREDQQSESRERAYREPVDRIFPDPVPDATDAQLLDWYAGPTGTAPWVSFNFVSSLDGAAALSGRSGGLGNAADQRIFTLMRRSADVLLVGAQTVRTEGYAGELLDTAAQQWRLQHGKPAHPAFAIVSGHLDLDPHSKLFAAAPVRPLIFTTEAAPTDNRRALSAVADVVSAGTRVLDIPTVIAELAARGLSRIHSEGGPHLFGSFQEAGQVDELCLSLSPLLVGGGAPRIAAGIAVGTVAGSAGSPDAGPQAMALAHILKSADMLFLRYLAAPKPGVGLTPHTAL
ncbi:pyrimidine reductase family protein [Paenarthrobacter sp. Z7-10]|uniref:pyrimidine reductase family protein n=1 Tax=Paenarthrobacter sp. Z7-10 TaxID=2787635 RepID=UPI0022A964AF|nr:pyrimidine reductase family protein [Paenarthrobacter sp. Z7-10]MCZ2402751.1 pyrimidine reductase family protein [Paenarthrobacter sp. Z7-10]